jgi:hypothetical protein
LSVSLPAWFSDLLSLLPQTLTLEISSGLAVLVCVVALAWIGRHRR